MDMIFIEILQFNCYAVPELPPSQNPLHDCTFKRNTISYFSLSAYLMKP